MSNETHEIRLVAKDGASSVFRMTGMNAERMNQQIERSNQRTKRSYAEIADASRRVGAAIGAMSAVSIMAANKSEVSQTRLKQSIEATGKSYDQYADAIDRASKKAVQLAFDDEDAADAISKLTQVTGDANKAIRDLSLAEDVARARGISLASAADLVAAAEAGRIGALRRMGIAIDENATSEQALAALRQKFAGQAEAYAATNAATWDRARINAENALEAIGAKLASHQGEILAASAAWTAFGSSIASAVKVLGASGVAQLLSFGGLAAVGVVGGTAAANWGAPGSNWATNIAGNVFATGESWLNAVVPGNPFHSQQWTTALQANTVEEAVKGLFYGADTGNPRTLLAILQRLGAIPDTLNVANLDQGAQDAYLTQVISRANTIGLTTGQYLSTLAGREGSHYVYDPVSGQYVDAGYYPEMQRARQSLAQPGGAVQGAVWNDAGTRAHAETAVAYGQMGATPGPPGDYANMVRTQDKVADKAAIHAAFGEWSFLADGITNAAGAMRAFQMAQANVMKDEAPFTQQVSEYSTQLGYLTTAYDQVNAKREQGIPLSKEEQQLLDGYPAAYERLTGGVADANLQLGLQAEMYAENMRIGDEMNKNLSDSSGATTTLTDAIRDLIAQLAGVPRNVNVAVSADLNPFYNIINNLLGQTIGSAYINVYANRIGFGPSADGMQHGGLVRAQHGYAGGGSVMVGEAGPEIVSLPPGSHVLPSAASRFSSKRRGGGGDMHFHGGITIVAQNPKQFGDQLRAYALAGARN